MTVVDAVPDRPALFVPVSVITCVAGFKVAVIEGPLPISRRARTSTPAQRRTATRPEDRWLMGRSPMNCARTAGAEMETRGSRAPQEKAPLRDGAKSDDERGKPLSEPI